MIDFSKFDNVNIDAKAIEEAKANGSSLETPKGNYIVRIEKMELGATKDNRPMFRAQFRVVDAGENATPEVVDYLSKFKNKKPCLFMNRVMYGTQNDTNMIASVLGWLDTLATETKAEFKSYSQFADNVLDIFEEVENAIELSIDYDPKAFNSVTVKEIYDI